MSKQDVVFAIISTIHKQSPVGAGQAQFECTVSGCNNKSNVQDAACSDCLTDEIVDLVGSDYEIQRYRSLLNIQRELIAEMLRKSRA